MKLGNILFILFYHILLSLKINYSLPNTLIPSIARYRYSIHDNPLCCVKLQESLHNLGSYVNFGITSIRLSISRLKV